MIPRVCQPHSRGWTRSRGCRRQTGRVGPDVGAPMPRTRINPTPALGVIADSTMRHMPGDTREMYMASGGSLDHVAPTQANYLSDPRMRFPASGTLIPRKNDIQPYTVVPPLMRPPYCKKLWLH